MSRPANDPCECTKYLLEPWWAAVIDAGNEGTDYKRHSRESCLTRTERSKAPAAPDLYGPMRERARKYLKAHTNGVPTQGEVDDLTSLLNDVRAEGAQSERARLVAVDP